MNVHRTKAIILRRTNYGEADRILQLLTPEGKRSAMARGVRRPKSRLAGGIELFAICEVVITDGRGDLGILTSAQLIVFYQHIIEDYDRLQMAYLAIKLVSSASEMVDGPEWYDVLVQILAGLNDLALPLSVIQTWFYLQYAALTGYELSLWQDVAGNKLLADKIYRYDVAERGLALADNGDLTSGHIKLLRLMATKPLNVIVQIGGIEQVIGDCLVVARQHAAI